MWQRRQGNFGDADKNDDQFVKVDYADMGVIMSLCITLSKWQILEY